MRAALLRATEARHELHLSGGSPAAARSLLINACCAETMTTAAGVAWWTTGATVFFGAGATATGFGFGDGVGCTALGAGNSRCGNRSYTEPWLPESATSAGRDAVSEASLVAPSLSALTAPRLTAAIKSPPPSQERVRMASR